MRNSILYRKILVLTLMTVLLVCGLQGVCHSQNVPETSEKTITADEMRKNVLPSVVRIIVEKSKGSGVVIRSSNKYFVLTNEHVTRGNDKVELHFLAHDSNQNGIRDREFYLNMTVLRRLGYIADGRVVAEDKEADVAIISFTRFPKTAQYLSLHDVDIYERIKKGEAIHFFGHPADKELLWEWAPGHFQGYNERELFFDGRPWKGNSGGPIVNKDGALIGLNKKTNDSSKGFAVSLKPIIDLENGLTKYYIFSIFNDTESTIDYEINWSEGELWEKKSLEPGEWNPHEQPTDTLEAIKPKIRYIPTQLQVSQAPVNTNGKDPELQSEKAHGNITNTEPNIHDIYVKSQFFGSDVKKRIIPKLDGSIYSFVNSKSENIELHASRETVWITNHTQNKRRYKIKWSSGRIFEDDYTLQPGKMQPHWAPKNLSKLPNYPKIIFEYSKDYRDGRYFSSTEALIIKTTKEPQFFPIDAKPDEHMNDLKESKHSINDNILGYYHFYQTPDGIKFLDRLPPTWLKRKSRIFGIVVPTWSIEIVCAIIILVIGFIGFNSIFPERHVFSILNDTGTSINYKVKWTPDKDYDIYSLDPSNELLHIYPRSPKRVPEDYPKIQFDTTVDDRKETNEQRLETYTWRFNREEYARNYHFEIDSETKALNLVDSDKDDI